MKNITLSIIALVLMSGCRTISYSDKAGNQLKIQSFVWDSSIGSLSASNGIDSISLSNYASKPDQQAMQLMSDMVKAGMVVPAVGVSRQQSKETK